VQFPDAQWVAEQDVLDCAALCIPSFDAASAGDVRGLRSRTADKVPALKNKTIASSAERYTSWRSEQVQQGRLAPPATTLSGLQPFCPADGGPASPAWEQENEQPGASDGKPEGKKKKSGSKKSKAARNRANAVPVRVDTDVLD
jgi:hypothetical protein